MDTHTPYFMESKTPWIVKCTIILHATKKAKQKTLSIKP